MTDEELLQFNPILAKALAQAELENNPSHFPREMLRNLVATCLKTGMPPNMIFAVIKTGRMATEENLKFLSKADIKEWEDACNEYDRLA